MDDWTIVQTEHGRYIGHTAATIIRRQYGRRARLHRGRVVAAGHVLATVAWIDGRRGR